MGVLTIGEIAELMGGEVIDGDSCLTISDYSYNSKIGDAQTLFLPIKGERVDAHDFIADAMDHGMVATTTERDEVEEDTEGMTYIHVDNVKEAIQQMGRRYRACFDIPTIGITGSVGKTTTKEMIAAALNDSLTIVKTDGNKNGQLGVPLQCMKLDEDTEALVLEMGVSEIGEMERLVSIAKPNMAVLTNIGMSHIGNFGDKEHTRREKLAIVNAMDENGILLLNGEDELLAEICPGSPNQKDIADILLYAETNESLSKIKRYSYGTVSWCDFRAENIVVNSDGTSFDWVHNDITKNVKLEVFGKHNVLNAVIAMAFAYLSNVDLDSATNGLSYYKPMEMRGNVEELDCKITLIDDSYNASPDSMKSGLEILSMTEASGKKIAVLADMLELGDYSEECHRLVGEYVINSKTDILIAIGKGSEKMADTAKSSEKLAVNWFESRDEAKEYLLSIVKPGDAVLCKGSRGMGLDKICTVLRELE